MKLRNIILTILLLSLSVYTSTNACTTAVIAAKSSSTGKSMIWKLRDTSDLENVMRYFDDGKYTYLGLVNAKDSLGEHVWGGANSAGFAIMNSASYNVNVDDTTQLKDQEGVFMKLALQTCATLEDLEKLLETYPKPRGQASHYGVIDANGGAAYYEVNNWTYTKYDVNDERVAPDGYLIRSNYSDSGVKDKGYGFIRRAAAETVFAKAYQNNMLNHKTVLQKFSRCTYHPILDINYRKKFEAGSNESPFVASHDLITRNSSVSSIVVEGVKPNQSPALTTVWTQIGYPNTAIAVPLWVQGGDNIPTILAYDEELKNSPLNAAALQWKDRCYPSNRSDERHYLKLDVLINSDNNGLIQRIEPIENKIFNRTDQLLSAWGESPPNTSDITNLYGWLNKTIVDFYENAKSEL